MLELTEFLDGGSVGVMNDRLFLVDAWGSWEPMTRNQVAKYFNLIADLVENEGFMGWIAEVGE